MTAIVRRGYRALPEPLRAIAHGGPLAALEELAVFLPASPRSAAERWIAAARSLRAAVRRRPLRRLTGPAAGGGGMLRLATDLRGDELFYWSGRLFAAPPAAELVGTRRAGAAAPVGLDVDLLLLERHRWLRPAASDGLLPVPAWLDTHVPLRGSLADTLAEQPAGRSRRSDLRRIERAGLRPRVARGATAVGAFLDDWYLPWIRRRWREGAIALDPGWRRRAWRICELLWIEAGGPPPLAGVLLEPCGAALRMVAIGLRDEGVLRDGVMGAAYAFSIERAAAAGCREVGMGGVRPVLADGLLTFKRKWGARVRPPAAWSHVGLGCRAWTAPVASTLPALGIVAEPAPGRLCVVARRDDADLARAAGMVAGIAGLIAPDDGGWVEHAPGRA